MSKFAEIDYDIECLFIEGMTEKNIAKTLDIPVEMVYAWMKTNGIVEFVDHEDQPTSCYHC